MGDDFTVGPFGRLLPRPIPSRSGSDVSSSANHTHPLDRPARIDTPPESASDKHRDSNHFPIQLAPFRPATFGTGATTPDWTRRAGTSISSEAGSSIIPPPSLQSARTSLQERDDLMTGVTGSTISRHNHSISPVSSDANFTGRGLSTHIQGKRMVSEEFIAGRGICYVYDDGTVCPKNIDGDNVNPAWGITKAGKPRKRLAQACTTCREKKIKCDPGSPKCLQCQKLGRECRFEPYARDSQRSESPSTTTNSPTASMMEGISPTYHRDSMASTDPTAASISRPLSSTKSNITLDNILSPSPSQDLPINDDDNPKKRPRHSLNHALPPTEPSPDVYARRKVLSRSPAMQLRGDPMKLEIDPYTLDTDLCQYYLDQYFNHVNNNNIYVFPRKLFIHWVKHNRKKSLWDNMMLYAMLALGTIFATNRERETHGKLFAKVAHKAESAIRGKFTLQAIQTRLILAMYNFARGNNGKAWDFSGAAVRCASGMKLSREEDLVDPRSDSKIYDLPRHVLLECKRRTFWATLIFDQLVAFCTGHEPCHIPDYYLRLPCEDAKYEEGNIPTTPLHGLISRSSNSHHDPSQNEVGTMGQLIRALALWVDVIGFVTQMRYKSSDEVDTLAESFHTTMMHRFDEFRRQMPSHLRYEEDTQESYRQGEENARYANRRGQLGGFAGMHIMFFCAVMRVNRHVFSQKAHWQRRTRNINDAYLAAVQTLRLVEKMAEQKSQGQRQDIASSVSTPFVGYAIICAVDVLTSVGSLSDFVGQYSEYMGRISASITALEQMKPHWKNTDQQLQLITDRYMSIMNATRSSMGTGKSLFYASMPIEGKHLFGRDILYSSSRRHILRSLGKGENVQSDDELLEIRRPSQQSIVVEEPTHDAAESTWFDDADDDDEDEETENVSAN